MRKIILAGLLVSFTFSVSARNGTPAAKIVENLGLPNTCTTCSGD